MQMQICISSDLEQDPAPTKSPQIDLGELSNYDVSHEYQSRVRSSDG